jgi:hypothetical protein
MEISESASSNIGDTYSTPHMGGWIADYEDPLTAFEEYMKHSTIRIFSTNTAGGITLVAENYSDIPSPYIQFDESINEFIGCDTILIKLCFISESSRPFRYISDEDNINYNFSGINSEEFKHEVVMQEWVFYESTNDPEHDPSCPNVLFTSIAKNDNNRAKIIIIESIRRNIDEYSTAGDIYNQTALTNLIRVLTSDNANNYKLGINAMEFVSESVTLFDILNDQRLTQDEKNNYVAMAFYELWRLFQLNLLHGDLTLANIVIQKNRTGYFKGLPGRAVLIDFRFTFEPDPEEFPKRNWYQLSSIDSEGKLVDPEEEEEELTSAEIYEDFSEKGYDEPDLLVGEYFSDPNKICDLIYLIFNTNTPGFEGYNIINNTYKPYQWLNSYRRRIPHCNRTLREFYNKRMDIIYEHKKIDINSIIMQELEKLTNQNGFKPYVRGELDENNNHVYIDDADDDYGGGGGDDDDDDDGGGAAGAPYDDGGGAAGAPPRFGGARRKKYRKSNKSNKNKSNKNKSNKNKSNKNKSNKNKSNKNKSNKNKSNKNKSNKNKSNKNKSKKSKNSHFSNK